MAAPPKLTHGRETRLFALLAVGEPLEAACRAVLVSATAIRKRAARDPGFRERLRAARAHEPEQPLDWTVIAAQLEREHPLRWALPDDPGEALDFDPLA